MMDNIGGWYRGCDIEGNDERLAQRRQAAAKIAEEALNWSNTELLQLCAFGLGALHSTQSESNISHRVVEAISAAQPSFDPQKEGADGDARICSLAAIENIIASRSERNILIMRKEPALLLAESVASATRLRVTSTGQAMAERVKELAKKAEALLSKADIKRRERRIVNAPDTTKLKSADSIEAVATEADKVIRRVWDDSLLDREELQVLWWHVGRFSPTLMKSYDDLSPGMSALAAGKDLANLLTWPGTMAFAEFAARMLSTSGSAKTRDKKIAKIPAEDWAVLDVIPDEELTILFPLHYYAATKKNGKNSEEALNGLRETIVLEDLARQAFVETSLLKKYDG